MRINLRPHTDILSFWHSIDRQVHTSLHELVPPSLRISCDFAIYLTRPSLPRSRPLFVLLSSAPLKTAIHLSFCAKNEEGRGAGLERETTQVVVLAGAPPPSKRHEQTKCDRGRPWQTDPPADCRWARSEPTKEATIDRPTDRGGRGCAAVASAAVIGAACNVLIERPGQRPACHSPLSPIPPHLTAATVCYAEPTFPRRGRPRNLCLTVNDCVRYDAATSASPLQQTPPMPTLVFCARLDPTGV